MRAGIYARISSDKDGEALGWSGSCRTVGRYVPSVAGR